MHKEDLEKLGYKLVWQDEFDGNKLDESSWSVEEHPDHWVNGELQSFVDDGKHVFVRDGHLVIKPERIIEPDRTISYKSARINTQGKRDFTYGYYETRLKISRGKGFLTSVRLLSTGEPYGEWPKSGSIDFLTVDGQYPDKGISIVHYGMPVDEKSGVCGDGKTDLSDEFHVYGMEWLPGKINFYFDGKEFFSTSYWYSRDSADDPKKYPAPFDKPFNIEINVSVGGDWVGAPDRTTVFDELSELHVDYIKVYQKDVYEEDPVMPTDERKFKDPDSTGNYISSGAKNWKFEIARAGEAHFHARGKELVVDITNSGDTDYSVQVHQAGLPLIKGKKYRVSFEAMAAKRRKIKFAVTAPDLSWKRYLEDTDIDLETNWQTHILPFEMKGEDDDNARVEFNFGNNESTAQVSIRNVRLEEVPDHEAGRRAIAICGAWEDAENYNLFLDAFMNEKVRRDYVVMGFTFGIETSGPDNPVVGLGFADFVDSFDLAVIIVFAEMIKDEKVLNRLREIGQNKGIPVVFLERQMDGVINAVLNYSDGFEKMVKHVLDHHGCKHVKFFAGYPDNPFSIERENIFKRVMLSHRLKVYEDDILYGEFWDATTVRVLNEKLDEGMEIPEAFICANDSMAVGVCDCLKKRGIRVPEDVIVTGFDGIWHGMNHSPSISTLTPDFGGLCDYVLSIIDNKDSWKSKQTIRKKIDYIECYRGSCGCETRNLDHMQAAINMLSDDNQDYFRHILEMGRFVTRTLSMSDLDMAASSLQNYLWLWKDQYYFVGLTEGSDRRCVHSLLHGNNTEKLNFKEKFYNMAEPLPEYDYLMARDSNVNILLFRQIRTSDAEYGYVCSGFDELTLRKQQRFEEFGLYFSAMVSSVIDKIKLIEANRAISQLNERDYLTNLYNRRGFFSRIEDMLKDPMNKGRIFSLFSIDMDGLKYINDHFGHQEGDNALIILAKSLLNYAGDNGICARYGGDEFAMAIVGDFYIADEYMNIREKIHGYAMMDPVVQELDYSVNASIGISECVITDTVDLEELIRFADLRMYEDKQKRKGSNEIR